MGFSLGRNYPNPFNSATAIRYTLGERRNVRIRVHDVLGRRVAVLVDGLQEPGIIRLSGTPFRRPAAFIMP